MSGYLKKRQKGTRWKQCWFVLKDKVLYTYKAPQDNAAVETLPVLGFQVVPLVKVRIYQQTLTVVILPPCQQGILPTCKQVI